MIPLTIFCPKCQTDVPVELRATGPHVAAYCATCAGFLRFIKKKDLWKYSSRELKETGEF